MSAGERTEKATPKKRRDERKRGHIFKSHDLTVAVSLLVAFGVLKIVTAHIGENLLSLSTHYFGYNADFTFNIKQIHNLMIDVIFSLAYICAPVYLFAALTGLLINYVQVGFLYTTKTIEVNLNRLNPIAGLKNLFSLRAVVELVKSTAKIAIIIAVTYNEIKNNLSNIPMYLILDFKTSWVLFSEIAMNIAFKAGIGLLVLGVGDYFYQWWRYEKDIMMTKKEVLDELKMMEGDPQIKSKIRQRQRQISMRRMMQDVPKADVVITNPTHYAICLKYDDKVDRAPKVIAKGKNHLAQKIKEIAKKHGIEMVENKPLARALYVYCDVGQEIPGDLYKAVAEVLAYVYRIRQGYERG